MTARVLAGKDAAERIRATTGERVADSGYSPVLVVVTATDDDASAWYVRSIARAADKVGVTCRIDDLGAHARGCIVTIGSWAGWHGGCWARATLRMPTRRPP